MIPRVRFAHLPTPVEAMPRLSAQLPGNLSLMIKRDDQTGLAGGGNKTRKLEFLIAEAQANGARTLVTIGAVQSNHCRQTAAAAAHFGFSCILVLVGSQPEQVTGNLLLDQILGAEIVYTPPEQREATLQATFDQAWIAGRRPYLIPYGGSNPTGAAGYAYAMQELSQQISPPDWIIVASSSGGTQAGLVLGARLFGFTTNILGISIDSQADKLKERVTRLAIQTADGMGEKFVFSPNDILVNDGYLGEGYGVMGASEREAIQTFAREEGILLDPVYSGKAAAGLFDLARKGYFTSGEKVLFWHTGGTPALYADRYRDGLIKA